MGMNQEGMPPSQLYAQLVERLDYLEYLKQGRPGKGRGARGKTSRNCPPCSSGTRRRPGEGASLSGFLEEVSLFTDIDNYDAGGRLPPC